MRRVGCYLEGLIRYWFLVRELYQNLERGYASEGNAVMEGARTAETGSGSWV